MKKSLRISFSLIALQVAGGCATVDPGHDYERVAEHVARATGHPEVYRPGDDELVAARVGHLLEGGLTCAEAVQLCLLNNPRLQAASFNVGMARADVVQSGLLSNPSLGVSLRFPAGGGLANLEAGLAQNIADLWQIPLRRQAAERELEQAILELARTASVLASATKSAYYAAVAGDRLREISRENVDIARKLLNTATARQEAGAGTQVDVNLALGELNEAELSARRAELAAYEARGALASLLGLTQPADEIDLVETLPDPPDAEIDMEALLEIATAHRLDLQAAREAVASAAAKVKEQQLRVFPSLEVGVDLERGQRDRSSGRKRLMESARATAGSGTLSPPPLEPDPGKDNEFIIGPSISLELPIFDQNQAQIARAEYAYRQAVKLLDALTREVTQEARLAFERARAAWRNEVFYREELLPLRKSSLELAGEAYRAGKVSFLSVLEAQRTLLAARASYVQTRRRSAAALADLEKVACRPISYILGEGEPREDPPAEDDTPREPVEESEVLLEEAEVES